MNLVRLFLATVSLAVLASTPVAATTLLEEKFDSTTFSTRGWFDSVGNLRVSTAEHVEGSIASLEMAYAVGAITPPGMGAPMRHTFTASDSVYLRYHVKYSSNWQGSNKSYHPHEFYLLTDADDKWIGPGNTHFTAYIEQNEGKLQLGIQDSLNVDATKISVDLTNVTENRGVSGCNGNADGVTASCYLSGTTYRNGKMYKTASVNFSDTAGPEYKADWHRIEAWFKMNSIVNGKGEPDGVMQLWYDDQLVVDRQNVIMRTGARATMKFNSVLIGPWIGDGSPVAQTTWIDELLVTDALEVQSRPSAPVLMSVE